MPSSASSKVSKVEISDSDSISIYLESLNAWLNGYFFSKLSLENSQLPHPPQLENTDLSEICSTLRSSIGKVRELAMKKISAVDTKTKEIPDKTKQVLSSKAKNNLKIEGPEEKKIQQLLDHTLSECRKKGYIGGTAKNSLLEKCEELCYNFLAVGAELQTSRARLKEFQSVGDSTKTRRIDEVNPLNLSKQSTDCNLLQIIYPLITRIHSLQEKKQFYSLLYRHYERFLKHEEIEVRRLLDTSKDKKKRNLSMKIAGICIVALIKISKLKVADDKITIKGVKIKPLDASLISSTKTLSFKSLPSIISSIHKSINTHNTERSTLNSLISASISVFQKFMNDIKTVLSILLKNNMEQKESVIILSENIKEIEEERDEIEGALTRTVEYTKNLEEEILEMTENPEYIKYIGEQTEMSLELESHKKALKGFTSQYNQLERKMDELMRSYEELKRDNEEKTKRLIRYEEKLQRNN